MISVTNLTRRFSGFRAVDGISFEIERGEVVGFLGVNGAGKTTTLRMLTGYLPATSGAISVCGFDVLRQSLEVRRRIGYLPESVPLYREHRVSEMLGFQARLHGIARGDRKARIASALERVGITDRSEHLIGKLSKGLRQRVGIAMALLPEPEVLILDEPTSGLDPLQRIEVRGLISELAQEHTVIFSSHILPEVEAVCPRVLIIHKGRIAADGSPEELVRQGGSANHVRLEAVVPDAEEALRLLGSLPGVSTVKDCGREGIHRTFEVACEEDLREDVGAVAAMRGWALRELSWRQPSLEQIFSRVAFELEDGQELAPSPAATAGQAANAGAVQASGLELSASAPLSGAGTIEVQGPGGSSAASANKPPAKPTDAGPKRAVFNLNPFDMGANRDLGAPKDAGPREDS